MRILQVDKWVQFSNAVIVHIRDYVVPQYGDADDLASDYTAEECVKQVEKYAKRFARSSRPGEQERDLLKMAHYAQKAWDKLQP